MSLGIFGGGAVSLGRGRPDKVPASLPLSVSGNSRYVMRAGSPLLLKEYGAWGLMQSLSEANARDFVDRRVVQGCTAMKVSLISADTRFPGSPPNWNGNAPFTTPGNFSTASGATAYWNHVDAMLDYMSSKGVVALAVPCYLGYAGDPNQGWAATMNADTDGHCATFGTFLGTRYAGRSNFAWLLGGDQKPGTGVGSSVTASRLTSLASALLAADSTHLVTAHWAGDYQIGHGADDPIPGGMLSTDYSTLASSITLNGLYSYNTSVEYHTRIEDGWDVASTRPILDLDKSYETDGGVDTQPQGTALEVRTKTHQAMCSGSCGFSFTCGSNWYLWADWTTDTQGQRENVYATQLWDSVPWHAMAPDRTSQYATSGRGTHGTSGYVCVLASATNLVAHFPNGAGRTLTIDMSKFASARRARWFDPTNGTYTLISSSLANSGTQNFVQPGANSAGNTDRILVLDT